MKRNCLIGIAITICAQALNAQTPVGFGEGSIASYPPTYKAKTMTDNRGFNATAMLSRKLYVDEGSSTEGILRSPEKPLPTNDWWTDLINSRFSGALWSYPAMLHTSETGVRISWPTYWADEGKEMKSRSHITVGGYRFTAESAIATGWHDWDVVFRMPSADGNSEMKVTSAHGMPFTWVEFTKMRPQIKFSETPEIFRATEEYLGIKIGEDLYGLYFPKNSVYDFIEGSLVFDKAIKWVSVGLLRDENELQSLAEYAVSIPRTTDVSWKYNEGTGTVTTEWQVEAENLRDKKGPAPVMQGFLPHVYKYMQPGSALVFKDETGYKTPRGKLKIAVSTNGTFSHSYQFSGMLPIFGAPAEGGGFDPQVMDALMEIYSKGGTFGGDTYWGGKGLTQMAMNMWMAELTGNQEVFEISKTKLREVFEDWLTYTPGEDGYFFSYYPRWGAMLGFDVSYDSDSFNDHHFHYGYFTYAAALLCLVDKDFAEKYGEILTMIAKDYANWDKDDRRFPFMRTMDPWNGHSWAGGLGDAGNDNGNGQESSSEAMQSWGGLYLLGVALDNKDMREAGIWGWSTEARATREYWYDVDAPRTANAGGRTAWAGKNSREGNYDYTQYPYAYNSNITGKGIGWWTWFGGDPLYMHGIQWMPVSPALDYLSWDTDFAAWAFDDMMRGANSSFSHDWFDYTTNSQDGSGIEPLANNDWGNVALSYMQRFDAKGAAQVFDRALTEGRHIATALSTGHISYYTIHSHLTFGDPDFTMHADIPTAQVCVKNGFNTYLVYNPAEEDRTVNFYNSAGAKVKTVKAPAGKLAAINADPKASAIEYEIESGLIIPPGDDVKIKARMVDQYGAGMDDIKIEMKVSDSSKAIVSGSTLKIAGDAAKGSKFILTLTGGTLAQEIEITVNDRPQGVSCLLTGVPAIMEKTTSLSPVFYVTDQYGTSGEPSDTEWTLKDKEGNATKVAMPLSIEKSGKYTLTAGSATMKAEAAQEIMVVPELPGISSGAKVMASSAENVGTLPAGVNDGDLTSRWGSAHTDNEWIVLDFGEDFFISHANVNWEAAYATRYEFETAPDGCDLTTMEVNYAGATERISVPAEEAWTTVAEVTNGSAGETGTDINTTGRYLRLKGKERATQYGYSIYEMNVRGVRVNGDPNDLIGVELNLPATLDRNTTVTLDPVFFTLGGESLKGLKVEWQSDREAEFKGNDFTPKSTGRYTVKAKMESGMEAGASVFVNDVEEAAYVLFDTENHTVVVGEPTEIPFTVMNQFMAPFTGETGDVKTEVTDGTGNSTEKANYDASTGRFTATEAGEYRLNVGDMGYCTITAKPLSEVNLALNRPVTASSANGGNSGAMAVDGNAGTRWESEWSDNQGLTVELDGEYLVDRIRIFWEGAYAKSYAISISSDYENWQEVYVEANSAGNTEEISFTATPARFVRIECRQRALELYGFSIWEFEVYGTEKLAGTQPDEWEEPGEDEPGYEEPGEDEPGYEEPGEDEPGYEEPGEDEPGYEEPGEEEDPDAGVASLYGDETGDEGWFTLQGHKINKPSAPGFYIRRANGKTEKIVIR